MGWIIVTLVVIIAACIACVLCAKQISKQTFSCKSCSKEFNVNWTKVLFAVHYENEYEIRCPYCNNKGCIGKK